ETLGLAFVTPEKNDIDARCFEMLAPDYIRKHLVLPMRLEESALVVAMTDPNNVFLVDEVRRRTKRDVKVCVTTTADIGRIVEQITAVVSDVKVDEIIKDMADDDVQLVSSDKEEVTDLAKIGNESPVIR